MKNAHLAKIIFLFFAYNIFHITHAMAQEKGYSGGFEYEDCGCDIKIDLMIHNGLNDAGDEGPFGGQLVQESEEKTIGAITVANKNDTDGDGNLDYQDSEVIGGSFGRDELDLMKLIINRNGDNFPENCEEKVRLEISGQIRFWEDYQKNTAIDSLEFSLQALPKTCYIEATEESDSLRDIRIEAVLGNTPHDTVRATAIWVDTLVKYVDGDQPDPLGGFINPSLANEIIGNIDSNGNYYGLGYFNGQDSTFNPYPAFGGRILLKFVFKPDNVQSLIPNLYLDVTRRLDEESGLMVSGTDFFTDNSDDAFLDQNEEPNDDTQDSDEDVTTSYEELYSYDAPNERVDRAYLTNGDNVSAFTKWLGTFQEFVRISFKPFNTSPVGEDVIGSRASDIFPWFHGRTLVSTSSNAADPYSAPNIVFRTITDSISHSQPVRTMGMGTGNIDIQLLPGAATKGYVIAFLPNNECALYDDSFTLVSSASKQNNQWFLTDSGKIEVVIMDDGIPYLSDDVLNFSVLRESSLFDKIRVE